MEHKDGCVLSSDGESCLKAQTRSLLKAWCASVSGTNWEEVFEFYAVVFSVKRVCDDN